MVILGRANSRMKDSYDVWMLTGAFDTARSSLDAQTRAMEEAARMLFRTEVSPALQRVALLWQHLAASGGSGPPGRPALGALAGARGDGSGGLDSHLGAGGMAVGAVSTTRAAPATAQWQSSSS